MTKIAIYKNFGKQLYVMPIVYIINMFAAYCMAILMHLPEMATFACWFILLISVANRVDADQARQNIWTWSESILFGKA